jgi:hypothetical protein
MSAMINPPKRPSLGDRPRIPTPVRKAGAKVATLADGAVDHIRGLVAPGASPEDLAEQLREKTEREAPKYQPLVTLGQELCQALGDMTRLRRFVEEVIRPMQRQHLDSRSAVTCTNDIFGRDVLRGARSRGGSFGGDLAITIGLGVALGFAVGYEKYYGLCLTGLLGSVRAFECWSRTVHAGTVEASGSVSIEFSKGAPEPKQPGFLARSPLGETLPGWDGWGVGWAAGGGSGATFGGGIAFKPDRDPVIHWAFKSVSVQMGGGAGASFGFFAQGCAARALRV